jgi:hypothetical protein
MISSPKAGLRAVRMDAMVHDMYVYEVKSPAESKYPAGTGLTSSAGHDSGKQGIPSTRRQHLRWSKK